MTTIHTAEVGTQEFESYDEAIESLPLLTGIATKVEIGKDGQVFEVRTYSAHKGWHVVTPKLRRAGSTADRAFLVYFVRAAQALGLPVKRRVGIGVGDSDRVFAAGRFVGTDADTVIEELYYRQEYAGALTDAVWATLAEGHAPTSQMSRWAPTRRGPQQGVAEHTGARDVMDHVERAVRALGEDPVPQSLSSLLERKRRSVLALIQRRLAARDL